MHHPSLVAAAACLAATHASAATMSTVLSPDTDLTAELAAVDLAFGEIRNPQTTNERDVKSNRRNAQSFTAPAAVLADKVVISFSTDAGTEAAGQFTFEFFAVADPQAAALNAAPVLIDSGTFTSPGANLRGLMLFDIVDTALSAGSAYAIRLNFTGTGNEVLKWQYIADYAGGRKYENNAADDAGSSGTRDYAFGVVAVPEPASLALLGLGGLACVARRRGHR